MRHGNRFPALYRRRYKGQNENSKSVEIGKAVKMQ